MATNYKVGDKIVLFKKHQEAIIRYVGKTEFAPTKTSYGLELCDVDLGGSLAGDNNGTVNGKKYFKCRPNKGLFVFEKDIKFKIKMIKKTHSSKNVKSPRTSVKRRTSSKKLSRNAKSDALNMLSTNNNTKKNTRKVPRNAKSDALNMLNNNNSAKKKTTKSTKRNKTSTTKQSKKGKKKKKKKGIKKKKKAAVITKQEASDSDSYKSGYSGASGHSGFDEDEEISGYKEVAIDIQNVDDIESNESEEDSDDADDEDIDENTLTGKVMMMMKQREAERNAKEEQDKIVMVAMTHKQMKKKDKNIFKDEEDVVEIRSVSETSKEVMDINEKQNEDKDISTNQQTEEEEEEEIENDLAEAPQKKIVKRPFKSYASRKGNAHDRAASDGKDDRDEDEQTENHISVKQEEDTQHKQTDSNISNKQEDAALNGKTKNVDDSPPENAQKGCCVLL